MKRMVSVLGLAAAAPALATAIPLPRVSGPSPDALAKLSPQALLASGCGFIQGEGGAAAAAALRQIPLIDGLAPIDYRVSTQVPEAQRYFNQGMALLYGFEFAKAEASFATGSRLDPACAMCLWGEALAIGPYINSGPTSETRLAYARTLIERALAMPSATEKERALILALQQRYAPSPPDNQNGVHAITFADAMQAVSTRYPDDDLIMVLAAEAAMNVDPWNYWEADNATARPWGRRAIALVEQVLARNPDQPEAQHLYIHLTEGSTTPGRAERFADMLEVSSPASAHLVHMPSHTYYRIGRFADGVAVNRKAIGVDEDMARLLKADPKYYGYFAHHTHFILSSAEQIGDRATALKAASDLEAALMAADVAPNRRMLSRLATPIQVRAQFARTLDETLAIPRPDARLPELSQLWWALRAEALGRAGQKAAAMREIRAMRQARGRQPVSDGFKPMVQLAETMALARIAEGSGNRKSALRLLGKAAHIESTFDYNEPPLWHQPVDAAIGGVLLRAGDAKGAKAAFARALVRRPGNAWALWGRAQAEAALGETQTSATTLAAYRKIWAGGDATPEAKL